ncbi:MULTISPECIES: hypothetical protein [Cyanophyceae]|nr:MULTISPECIES: hypothetical protein [Cyanophyceae]ACA99866.1 conserved hypothetical protein [Picosynechococcus sp. PCC 7002]SMH55125.1 hypothetical protein SAMN06272755_2913 [Picosynechococcus sp. OG1]SMQ83158.1 hypothetical protein SAMN06272774_2189 [Synechococcus sp. 7002]
MPMKRELYPDNWEAIALEIKESVHWFCEKCGRPCRRPGEDWFDFLEKLQSTFPQWYQQYEEEVYDDDTGEWGYIEKRGRFILTVAHLDHNPANCDRQNLKALCSVCHLRNDHSHHLKNASRTRFLKKQVDGQLSLFE